MIGLLARRRMRGGLYFGPAGWMPEEYHAPREALPRRLHVLFPPGIQPAEFIRVGQTVRRGEVLWRSNRLTEPDVICPLDGDAEGFADVISLHGDVLPSLRIRQRNVNDLPAPAADPSPQVPPANRTELIHFLQSRGIGACSPHAPSLLRQLASLGEGRPSYLVINMLSIAPESRLPNSLAVLDNSRLRAGLDVLRNAIGAKHHLVALDRMLTRQSLLWRRSFRRAGFSLRRLLNRYPQADPTVLLWTMLGRKLPVGASPTQVGVVLVDPVTLWAVGGALQSGQPFLERPVELFAAGESPRIALVPLGTSLSDALTAHGMPAHSRQCIVNGMMAGREMPLSHPNPPSFSIHHSALSIQQAVVESATDSISVRPLPALETPSACISCGWCVDLCPTELTPVRLYQLALAKGGVDSEDAREALHCIGCGLCSYVCPTRLPLTQEVVGLRGAVRRAFGPAAAKPAGGLADE